MTETTDSLVAPKPARASNVCDAFFKWTEFKVPPKWLQKSRFHPLNLNILEESKHMYGRMHVFSSIINKLSKLQFYFMNY